MLTTTFTLLALGLLPQNQVSGRNDDRAIPGSYPIEELRTWLASPAVQDPLQLEPFLGLPLDLSEFIPADNPLTPAKVELGRQLYFDKRLSRDGTISCTTCHDPSMGWTDNAPVSTGIDGQRGARSAPTVINRLFGRSQFWDGRAASLEEQALGPIANPIEMGFTVDEAVELLNGIEGYRLQFKAVFGSEATADGVAKAIAAFERTILSGASKNDYYERAMPWFGFDPAEEEDAELAAEGMQILALERTHRMSEQALRGRVLYFGKAKCSSCHAGQDLSDEAFHNLGVGMDSDIPDLGLFDQTGKDEDRGKFKTPSLRNIALTAPYMHDGSQATLMETVLHYDKGGTKNSALSEKIFKLNLTEQERQDLVRFMEEALSGQITEVEVPRLP